MSLPKEIAEKIIKGKEYITSIDTEPRKLARAYLELEKEITKLKKSREVLRKAVEFYGDRETWELSGSLTNKRYFKNLKSYGEALNDISEFQVPNTFGYAHENKELTYYIAGKKAREALKADDETMGDGK